MSTGLNVRIVQFYNLSELKIFQNTKLFLRQLSSLKSAKRQVQIVAHMGGGNNRKSGTG